MSCQAPSATEPRSFSMSVPQLLFLLKVGELSQTSCLWFGTSANGPTPVDPVRVCKPYTRDRELQACSSATTWASPGLRRWLGHARRLGHGARGAAVRLAMHRRATGDARPHEPTAVTMWCHHANMSSAPRGAARSAWSAPPPSISACLLCAQHPVQARGKFPPGRELSK